MGAYPPVANAKSPSRTQSISFQLAYNMNATRDVTSK
jgi:hypothetical protein